MNNEREVLPVEEKSYKEEKQEGLNEPSVVDLASQVSVCTQLIHTHIYIFILIYNIIYIIHVLK